MACARETAHASAELPAEHHAQLHDSSARCGRLSRPDRARRFGCAGLDRLGLGGTPSAACIWGGRARRNHPQDEAAGDRDFRCRRSRRPALRAARQSDAKGGRADRGRTRVQHPTLARAGARRGIVRVDRRLHTLDRPQRRNAGRGTPPLRGLPACRYRLARSSRLSRRAVAQHDCQCVDHRYRSSRACVYRAGHRFPL